MSSTSTASAVSGQGLLNHRGRPRASTVGESIRDSISDNIKSAVDSLTPTLHWNDIPEWMRDNEYILTGYRRVQNSWKGCFHSLFSYFHNESINVHSHLWPAILFLFLLISIYGSQLSKYESTTWLDGSTFAIFLATATFCLTCSAAFHLAICHSESVALRAGCLDYCGIIALIVGSFYPCVYYGFFCSPSFQIIYLAGITIAGIGAATVVLTPRYAKPDYRAARAGVFVSLGLFAVLPVGHALIRHGPYRMYHEMGFAWLLLSGLLYLTGAFIYAYRFPECYFPGKFDYIFASHQIFHIHVVLAVLAHYLCILKAFHHWHGVMGGSCAAP